MAERDTKPAKRCPECTKPQTARCCWYQRALARVVDTRRGPR